MNKQQARAIAMRRLAEHALSDVDVAGPQDDPDVVTVEDGNKVCRQLELLSDELKKRAEKLERKGGKR